MIFNYCYIFLMIVLVLFNSINCYLLFLFRKSIIYKLSEMEIMNILMERLARDKSIQLLEKVILGQEEM